MSTAPRPTSEASAIILVYITVLSKPMKSESQKIVSCGKPRKIEKLLQCSVHFLAKIVFRLLYCRFIFPSARGLG